METFAWTDDHRYQLVGTYIYGKRRFLPDHVYPGQWALARRELTQGNCVIFSGDETTPRRANNTCRAKSYKGVSCSLVDGHDRVLYTDHDLHTFFDHENTDRGMWWNEGER